MSVFLPMRMIKIIRLVLENEFGVEYSRAGREWTSVRSQEYGGEVGCMCVGRCVCVSVCDGGAYVYMGLLCICIK